MKKRGLLALGLAAAMAVTTACSGGGKESTTKAAAGDGVTEAAKAEEGSETASGEEITLKIANYAILEAGYDTFWADVKEGFEAKYPNIKIEWVSAPYGEILNQVINMAGGGDKVDAIFSEMIWIPALVDAGLAAPMDEVLSPEFLADYYPNILAVSYTHLDVYKRQGLKTRATIEEALQDAMKKYVGPNPKILALPQTFKLSAVHLMMKDEVYDGTNHCAHPDAYVK